MTVTQDMDDLESQMLDVCSDIRARGPKPEHARRWQTLINQWGQKMELLTFELQH